jgi:hypothetical protein
MDYMNFLFKSLFSLSLATLFLSAGCERPSTPSNPRQHAREEVEPGFTALSAVKDSLGKTVKVRCRIYDVVEKPYVNGHPTFLDTHSDWTRNPFSITAFGTPSKKFPDLDKYRNKTVIVSGKVEKYEVDDDRGGPTMKKIGFKLTTPSQITIIN